jgi:hypothetical protein
MREGDETRNETARDGGKNERKERPLMLTLTVKDGGSEYDAEQ